MIAILTPVISLLEQLLPLITSASNASLIGTIINVLTGLIPSIVSEAEALYTPIKNIIAALSANPATTAAQLQTLQTLDAQADAAFEAAAAQTDADGGTAASTT